MDSCRKTDYVTSNACTFPSCPSVDLTKSCTSPTSCTATSISYDITVTNNGPMTDSCMFTETGSDCSASPDLTNMAPGAVRTFTCSKTAAQNVATTNSASVSCTDTNGNTASDNVTSNACTIP